MSSFKRRLPVRAPVSASPQAGDATSSPGPSRLCILRSAPLPAGVRPSPHPSPVPHLSSGLASLDDLLTGPGGGLPSTSTLVLIPSSGLAELQNLSAATCSTDQAHAQRVKDGLERAKHVCDSLLSYGVAQAIESRQLCLIVGPQMEVGGLLRRIPSRAGEPSSLPPQLSKTMGSDGDAAELGSASRYAGLAKVNSGIERAGNGMRRPQDDAFCSPFDLSKPASQQTLKALQGVWGEQGCAALRCHELADQRGKARASEGEVSLQKAWSEIERALETAHKAGIDGVSTPLRIVLSSFASPSWFAGLPRLSRGPALLSFLLRLKSALRSYAARQPPLHCIVTISLSPTIWSPGASLPLGVEPFVFARRLASLVDGALSLSSFAPFEALQSAYPAYGGAIKILKAPAIGSIHAPSEIASVLRGLGSGGRATVPSGGWHMGSLGAGVGGGGGDGGGENDLGYKMVRRGIRFETLHLDVDGGVSERRTKPLEAASGEALGEKLGRRPQAGAGGEDIEEAGRGLRKLAGRDEMARKGGLVSALKKTRIVEADEKKDEEVGEVTLVKPRKKGVQVQME